MRRAVLDIGGLEASAPLRISLNGAVILEKKNTSFPDLWTVKVVPLKSGELRVGTNTLEIENTGNGPVSAVPWFGISFVRVRTQVDEMKRDADKNSFHPRSGFAIRGQIRRMHAEIV